MASFSEINSQALEALETHCNNFVECEGFTEQMFADKAIELLGHVEAFRESDIDEKHEFGEGLTYAAPYVSDRMVVLAMFMQPGASIDAHDHHGFAGVMRVIQGQVEVHNFTLIDGGCTNDEFNIKSGSRSLVAQGQYSAILSDDSNIHQVTAGERGAIFLDVYVMVEERGRSDFFEFLRTETDGQITARVKASVGIPE